MEYVTRYPKTVSLQEGEDNKIHVDKNGACGHLKAKYKGSHNNVTVDTRPL